MAERKEIWRDQVYIEAHDTRENMKEIEKLSKQKRKKNNRKSNQPKKDPTTLFSPLPSSQQLEITNEEMIIA